ncbi:PAS domain S-box protein [Methanoregula sp.]|uniref:PAS domain S-box protein n=1 Tax=Methanoregula sp. TaxID=2052170 RepID=UPI003C76DBA9
MTQYSVLYVDDEQILLDLGKTFLEHSGSFTVERLTSAGEAIEKLKTTSFDCIVSDYQMPVMDGIVFLKYIRTAYPELPFILFTGRGREEVVIEAFANNADFYLQKGGNPTAQFVELEHKIKLAIERRQMAKALRESEERYRNVVEDQTEFISRFLPDGTHVFVNEAYCRYYDLKRDEILGHWFKPNIPVEDQKRVKRFFASLTPDHPVNVIEHRIIMPDGAIRWLRWSDRAIFDHSGTITEYQSVGLDITEEKATKVALQESEKRFRELSDLLPQVVYEADIDGNLTYANHIAFERFGYTEDDFRQGLNVMQMFAPYDLERVSVDFRAMVEGKGGKEHTGEYMAMRKDCSTFPISIYSSPIVADGRITGLRGIIVDITDRKRAEERLSEVNDAFLAFTPDPLRNINILTGLAGKMLQGTCALYNRLEGGMLCSLGMWNTPPAFASCDKPEGHICNDVILNGGLSPMIITNLPDSTYADTDPNVKRYQLKTYVGIPVKIGEKFLGSLCVVYQDTYSPSPRDLEILSFLAKAVSVEDERRTVEKALQLANKKLTFLSSITRHDILNQLTVLHAYLALSKEEEKDPKLAGFISREEKAAEAIGRQIKFTRFYEDIGVNAPRWQDVSLTIRSSASQLPLASVILAITVSGVEVYADPLIAKVFYNLIENSLRHGGHVTRIGFSFTESEEGGLLVYEDDGMGIMAEDRDLLFTRGFGKHTGLGLFLSREILSLTGITFRETGQPHKGVRFEIIIPKSGYRFNPKL